MPKTFFEILTADPLKNGSALSILYHQLHCEEPESPTVLALRCKCCPQSFIRLQLRSSPIKYRSSVLALISYLMQIYDDSILATEDSFMLTARRNPVSSYFYMYVCTYRFYRLFN